MIDVLQPAGITLTFLGGGLMLIYSGALRRPLNPRAATGGLTLVLAGGALQLWGLHA